jgi:hypothetical protein
MDTGKAARKMKQRNEMYCAKGQKGKNRDDFGQFLG